jgi:hypothetical protein
MQTNASSGYQEYAGEPASSSNTTTDRTDGWTPGGL